MRRADVVRGVVAAVIGALAAGCATIPSAGPVHQVKDDSAPGQSTVRYSPARPAAGATPEQVVRGYLDAMLAFPASARTASAFLTDSAADDWRSGGRTVVYSSPLLAAPTSTTKGLDDSAGDSKGSVDVRLDYRDEARLDGQGHYTRTAHAASTTFTLRQVDGEWRITNPPDGTMISRKFFADYFRPFDLFYFDHTGRRLVPDPVHLLAGEQITTSLLTSLLQGPSARLDRVARTYAPAARELRPSVPVDREGIADVEFSPAVADLGRGDRDRLSAQIVWTLRQAPGLRGVRIVAGSSPLSSSGRDVTPMSAWSGYGPSEAKGRAYAVADDTVVQIDDADVQQVDGVWGRQARGAQLIAVSSDDIAGVVSGGTAVRVMSRTRTQVRSYDGRDLIAPQWGVDGRLWLVDRDDDGTRVRLANDGDVAGVETDGLRELQVDRFQVSPDGARYVASTTEDGRRRLRVGLVLHDAKGRVVALSTPRRLATTSGEPRSATWASSTTIAFLGRSAAGLQVYQVAADGSTVTDELVRGGALLPDVDATTLAIGRGDAPDLYVTDAKQRLWFQAADSSWRQLDTPPITGLTYGP